MSKKITLLPVLLLLVTPALVSADCTDLVKHNDNSYTNDDYEEYDAVAEANAEIDLSRIYGEDCSDNPYKNYAKVRVKCTGDQLYMIRASQDSTWDDIDFDCSWCDIGKCASCGNYDKSFSSGTHTVTLRNKKGSVDSVFFKCLDWDVDYGDRGAWAGAWATVGWGLWGDKSVFKPRVERKCSNNDVYWYGSLGRRGDKYEDCGSDSCDSWNPKYCENNKVKHSRTCYNRGCDSNCYENTNIETKTLKTCKLGCYNGKCQNDKDNDGIIDRKDNCPDEAGSGSNGCPNFLEKVVHFFGFEGWTM